MKQPEQKLPERYKFQFNGDEDSCRALADMFRAGWELQNIGAFSIDDGHHWIHLQRWGNL